MNKEKNQSRLFVFTRLISCLRLTGLVLATQTCMNTEDPLNWLQRLQGDASTHFYFSHPQVEAPVRVKRHARDMLIQIIDSARTSVEFWCYGLDEPLVIDALARARSRAIEVSIIGDPDTNYDEAEAAGLSIARRDRSGIQHVKLALVDRRILFTGTGNITTSGFFYNNNAFFHLIVDRTTADAIARALAFESQAGPPLDTPFNGRLFFAPRQGRMIQSHLIQAILSARTRIRFMIFSFTDPLVTAALYLQASKGIIIEGIYDDEYGRQQFDSSSQGFALNENLGSYPGFLYLDGNFQQFEKRPGQFHGGHLHHKTLIIDDQRVLSGSYNWSNSARDRNLEVFFDFQNRAVAARFNQEFNRIRSRALLQGRAPVAAAPALTTTPALLRQNDLYCPGADSNATPEFSVFSGRGPYFRALRFVSFDARENDRGQILLTGAHERRCFSASIDTAPNTTAGLPIGESYALVPPGPAADDWNEPSVYTYDLRYARAVAPPGPDPQLPCEDPRSCAFFTLRQLDTNAGWLWLDEAWSADATRRANPHDEPIELRVWSREGLSDWITLTKLDANFYSFPARNTTGDQILFTRDAGGLIRVACVQNGKSIDPTPAHFMNALTAAHHRIPECLPE